MDTLLPPLPLLKGVGTQRATTKSNDIPPPSHQTGNGNRSEIKNRMKTRSQLSSVISLPTPSVSSSPSCARYTSDEEISCIWNAQNLTDLVSCVFSSTGRHRTVHAWNSNFQCWNMATAFLNKVLIKHNIYLRACKVQESFILPPGTKKKHHFSKTYQGQCGLLRFLIYRGKTAWTSFIVNCLGWVLALDLCGQDNLYAP